MSCQERHDGGMFSMAANALDRVESQACAGNRCNGLEAIIG